MKIKMWKIAFVMFCAPLLVAMTMGCGSSDNSAAMLAEQNDNNVKRLANLYSVFQSQHEWRGPDDEAEFKSFINGMSPARMERVGVDVNDVDGLFVGTRDNQPLKIRWGLLGRMRGPSLPVVFEAEGMEGKRRVGFTNSAMQEVDSTEYDRLWNVDPDDMSDPTDERGDG